MKKGLCLLLCSLVMIPTVTAGDLRLPALPTLPDIPRPMPSADASTRLSVGQYYVITDDNELIIDVVCGSGSVTISKPKKSISLPADMVVGYKPDIDDPDFVTFSAPYIYLVRAVQGSKSGPVTLQVIPTVVLDKDGKPRKLEKSDVKRRHLDVDGGTPTPTPADPIKPDALTAAVQTAFNTEPATVTDTTGTAHTRGDDRVLLAASFTALATATDKPEIKTSKDLFDTVHATIENQIKGRLPATRTVLGNELKKVLPPVNPPAVLTQQNRDDAKALFTKFATVLENLK